MPAVTRTLSIVYGSTTFGGTSERLLHDRIKIDERYESITIGFDFVITATTDAAFKTEIAAVESALRTPRQRLRVIQGAETIYDFDPSTNSGFNAAPSIAKLGDDVFDSGRSRLYSASIDIELPADLTGQNGRRDSTVTLDFSNSRRRTLTVAGRYTAITSGITARAQYDANIATYITALTSGFGGTWEKISETATADDTDKNLDFTQVFQEIIFNDTASAINDSAIVDPRLTITRVEDFSTGAVTSKGIAQPFIRIQISYDAGIDKDVTTDLKGKYDDVIRQYLIDQAFALFGLSGGAVVNESVGLDATDNRITVSMELLARSTSNVVEGTRTIDTELITGMTAVPVWAGDPLAKFVFQGPAIKRRIVTEQISILGNIAGGGGNGARRFIVGINLQGIKFGGDKRGAGAKLAGPIPFIRGKSDDQLVKVEIGGEVFVPISNKISEGKRTIGKAPDQQNITEITVISVEEAVKPVIVSGPIFTR